MSKLSVALAVYNEEENIGRCLDSVKDIADEIVIVDGGSIDKTVEIAKGYRAKVLVTDNPAIFHINKQKAIDMAKCDWILQLDADEIVSQELAQEIKNQKSKIKNEFNGYWIPRKNWFLGRFLMKGGQYPDYTMRFYRKGKGYLPQKSVHEQAEVKGEVGYLTNPLLHYPYKDFDQYLEKWDNYCKLIANEIKERLNKKNTIEKLIFSFVLVFIKPVYWFFMTYVRHKGFVDSWQGFIFSFFSALRFPAALIKTF